MLGNIKTKEQCVRGYLNPSEGSHTKKKQHIKRLSTFIKLNFLFPKFAMSICTKIMYILLKNKILCSNIIKAVLKFVLVTISTVIFEQIQTLGYKKGKW